jgi:hypothetical protein
MLSRSKNYHYSIIPPSSFRVSLTSVELNPLPQALVPAIYPIIASVAPGRRCRRRHRRQSPASS